MGGQHNALVLLEEQGVGTFQLRRGIEVRASINFEDFLLEKIQIFGKSSLLSAFQHYCDTVIFPYIRTNHAKNQSTSSPLHPHVVSFK